MIPLGLVVNELITNSLKYAFVNKEAGKIKISLKEKNGQLYLNIADNGHGVDPTILESKSFGYSLIKSFAKRLDASLDIKSEEGTCRSYYQQL